MLYHSFPSFDHEFSVWASPWGSRSLPVWLRRLRRTSESDCQKDLTFLFFRGLLFTYTYINIFTYIYTHTFKYIYIYIYIYYSFYLYRWVPEMVDITKIGFLVLGHVINRYIKYSRLSRSTCIIIKNYTSNVGWM